MQNCQNILEMYMTFKGKNLSMIWSEKVYKMMFDKNS